VLANQQCKRLGIFVRDHLDRLRLEDLMSDTVNFTELDGQHVELLPARTVLSMFAQEGGLGDALKDPTKLVSMLFNSADGSKESAGAAGESK
jgi:hypothetical protein